MHKYRLVAKKGEGTFSEVLKAQCIKNGKYVAIKCMKNHFDSLEQVNNLREIQALRRLSPHPNIIKLLEVLYDQPTGRLALVFELMDMNIYELIRGRRHYVAEDRVKRYMYQLMKAMDHMHRNGIFHRDIKPENILIMDESLKLADFGSCRGIHSKQPFTEYISTRWYRAPECLLTDGYYNYKMDMWGVGCVFFEIVSLFPLFPGNNELDQIKKIHNVVGTPPPELLQRLKRLSSHMDCNFPPQQGMGIDKLVPHVPAECVDLINRLLAYNPDDRLSARQALRHPYFKDLRDAEKRQRAMMAPELSLSQGSLSLYGAEGRGRGDAGSRKSEAGPGPGAAAGTGAGAGAAGGKLHAEKSSDTLPSIQRGTMRQKDDGIPPVHGTSYSRANSKVPSEASDTEHDGDHNLPPIGGASGSIPGPRVVARAKGGGGAGAGAGTSAHHGFQSRSTYQAQGKHRQKRAAGATGFAGSQAGGATLHSYTSASKAKGHGYKNSLGVYPQRSSHNV